MALSLETYSGTLPHRLTATLAMPVGRPRPANA